MPLPIGRRRPPAGSSPRSLEAAVRAVQIAYPRIYLACHTRHTRARSSAFHLSARDSSLLVHLDETHPTRPAALARHMGVVASTMSAALQRLESLGYVTRTAAAADRRAAELRLSATGAEALRATSVLEAARVRALLRALTPQERTRAVEGLALLGAAARALGDRAARPRGAT
jgi:MarR family transcriptional regulator, organic hydroperoxide resistance regulator